MLRAESAALAHPNPMCAVFASRLRLPVREMRVVEAHKRSRAAPAPRTPFVSRRRRRVPRDHPDVLDSRSFRASRRQTRLHLSPTELDLEAPRATPDRARRRPCTPPLLTGASIPGNRHAPYLPRTAKHWRCHCVRSKINGRGSAQAMEI